ncbi:hypothetical protein DH2020_003880 [Rehmannia glutinosa]|uniref:NTF2 domain-containing protein n=1 Tax=Rehmannia glutinosa TaxID=99300 RepID=A0ABR0XMW5_REHGL
MDPDAVAKAAGKSRAPKLLRKASQFAIPKLPKIGSPPLIATLRPVGGMLVFVSGTLEIIWKQDPLKFSRMFHPMPTPQGSFYVFNDIFLLNYA